MQGLDPLVHVQDMVDSGLNKADAAVYAQAASGISAAMSPGTVAALPPAASRSLWSRAGEIASGLMAALRRLDSRPGNAVSHVDQVPETPGPVRFLDSPPGPRVPDPEPFTGAHAPPPGEAARLNPTRDGDGARWADPAAPRDRSAAAPWGEPP